LTAADDDVLRGKGPADFSLLLGFPQGDSGRFRLDLSAGGALPKRFLKEASGATMSGAELAYWVDARESLLLVRRSLLEVEVALGAYFFVLPAEETSGAPGNDAQFEGGPQLRADVAMPWFSVGIRSIWGPAMGFSVSGTVTLRLWL